MTHNTRVGLSSASNPTLHASCTLASVRVSSRAKHVLTHPRAEGRGCGWGWGGAMLWGWGCGRGREVGVGTSGEAASSLLSTLFSGT